MRMAGLKLWQAGISTVLATEECTSTRTRPRNSRPLPRRSSVPHDSGVMRGRRAVAGERRTLQYVLFHAALAAACHNLALKPFTRHQKVGQALTGVFIAIARRPITIANAVLKTGEI